MLKIDGSYGEGGGQVLRTSLSLAAVTGRPFHLEKIRAGRSKPGLRPQHLTAVQAAAAVCQAELEGAAIGSQSLTFRPQRPPQGGNYRFDVEANAPHGSAGSATLIAQTVLWPLLFAERPARVIIRGGTHVPFSPSFHYLQYVVLPAYRRLGVRLILGLHEWGWLPKGGGQIELEIEPLAGLAPADFEPVPADEVRGLSVVTNLPGHIPHRMARRADNLLGDAGVKLQVDVKRLRSHEPGAGLFLWLPQGQIGAGSLGRQGLPAQEVAEIGVAELLAGVRSGAAVDVHLADQLLLPMALAAGRSTFTAPAWTSHAETNATVLRQWLEGEIVVEEQGEGVVRVVVDGRGEL